MAAKWVWVAGTTEDGARLKARLTSPVDAARWMISTSPDLSDPIYSDPVAPDDDLYVALEIDGLTAANGLWYYTLELDGSIDAVRGTFRTLPAVGSETSFLLGFASCAVTTPGRNYPVYERIIEKDPLMFIHMGDFHYDIPTDPDPATWVASDWQTPVDKAMAQSHRYNQHKAMAVARVWDDHDYNPNQVGAKSFPKKDVAATVYRQVTPHYDLPASDADPDDLAIYQSWQIGRVYFIMPDLRYHRDMYNEVPNGATTGTMLGDVQKAWVKDQLDTARDNGCKLIVLVSSSVWSDEKHDDSWGPAGDERTELVAYATDNDCPPVIVFSGDMHGLAYSAGWDTAGYTMWPEHVSASLAASPGAGRDSAHWVYGQDMGMGSYSTLAVTDNGDDDFSYTVTGYRADLVTGEEVVRYSVTNNLSDDPGIPPTPGDRVVRSAKIFDGEDWTARPAKAYDPALGRWKRAAVRI